MSVLEALLAADRVVLAGLSAYDEICGRELVKLRPAMKKAGHPEDEIESAVAEHAERIRTGRGRLHRELWTKAMAVIATGGPPAPQDDEVSS